MMVCIPETSYVDYAVYASIICIPMKVEEVARRLRERMETERLSQVTVAKATGVHQSQISRFRAGKFAENSDNLRRVCQYAGVNLDEPLTRTRDDELLGLFNQLVANLDPVKRRALSAALRNLLRLV